MKVSLIYFTYKNDAELLEQSIISFEKTTSKLKNFEYNIHIFDDNKNPINPEFLPILLKYKNTHYYQTNYNRNKNLNGYENNVGESFIFKDCCEKDKSDFIIKADSDIYFPPSFPNWIEEFYNSDKLYTGGYIINPKFGKAYFAGGCYMIKNKTLSVLYNDILKNSTYWMWAPEDYIMCSRLKRNFPNTELDNHRIYTINTFPKDKLPEKYSGYHLDPRIFLQNSDFLKYILETSIYIATWDSCLIPNISEIKKNKLKIIQLQIFKNLNLIDNSK